MNPKFTIFFLLFALAACNKEIELGEPINREHFYKLYGTYYWDYSNSVIETQDGGLIWVGYTSEIQFVDQSTSDFESWPYICKVLPNGMVDWDTNRMVNFPKAIAHDVKLTDKNNGIHVSISQKKANGEFSLHLIPISLSGTFDSTISTTIYTHRIISANIIVKDDDSIRVVAQTEDIAADTTTSLYVFKLNSENKLEETYVHKFNDRLPDPIRAAYLSDDNFILASTANEDKSTGNHTDIRVLSVIDQEIIWNNVYGEPGISESCSDLKIIDDDIVVAGNHSTANTNNILTLTIDIASRVGEFVKYDSLKLPYINCTSFDLNVDNNYVFTGSFVFPDAKVTRSSDIFFVEASKSGEIIQHQSYGNKGIRIGENKGEKIISIDNSEDYFLLGILEPIENTDILIFKLDKFGSWLD